MGDLTRQQLELFSISQLFTCIVDADDDSLFFECTITPSAPLQVCFGSSCSFQQQPAVHLRPRASDKVIAGAVQHLPAVHLHCGRQ